MWKNAFEMWAAGTSIGLRTLPREPILGLKRIALPVSYWRTAEFGYVCRQLPLHPGGAVLDVGSPKELAVILARSHHSCVTATDILPAAVELSRRYACAQDIDGSGPGRVHSEVQDGRSLGYPNGAFASAFSVSVLEHIPGEGDSAAIAELVRVVEPGGKVIVTIPFDVEMRETFVDRSVYERQQIGTEPVFFQRHYDEETLMSRLIEPSGAILSNLEIWGEGPLPAEKLLQKLGKLGLFFAPVQPFIAAASLRQLGTGRIGRPMAAFLTFTKKA